ncbi:Tautomerase PptA [Shewanella mangrovi]|uniref:Tautomerase PptA n=1 Tax=Shewanella mangrovi TaxID=1515746 RepID=A0A094LTM4_9GAMM|nr:tautomerase PptA [Shewanella mangrovi]KFZ38558.1 Tautomerase PptA [Shewanella mangrovi]
MPHVQVSFVTRNLTDEQQQNFADDLAQVLKKHLNASDDAISVALEEVDYAKWQSDVYEPRIKPQLATLAKKPGYEM